MEETGSKGMDCRRSFATHIASVSGKLNRAPGFENRSFDTPVLPKYINESLQLPSSQRLNSLNQISPVAEKVLGFEVSRGQHTEDAMRLASSILHQLSASNSEAFAQFTANYTNAGMLTPVDVIQHCVEYMRLHDAATLAFQGAMHGKVMIDGKGYDEDVALLKAFENNSAYQPVIALLFDEPTFAYYKSSGIDKKVLKRIANDAVHGATPLGSFLKKGGGHPPVDWLAYTARDFYELTRIFNIDEKASFSEKISGVLSGLENVSTSLEKDSPLHLSQKRVPDKTIEELIPAEIVKWDMDQGSPRLVYDGTSIAQLYLMHMVLRTHFSGSPWIRGTHQIINETMRNSFSNEVDLLHKLLAASENELFVTAANLQISGWSYTTSSTNRAHESFVCKEIGQTVVSDGRKVKPFNEIYPELVQILIDLKKQPLYLKHNP